MSRLRRSRRPGTALILAAVASMLALPAVALGAEAGKQAPFPVLAHSTTGPFVVIVAVVVMFFLVRSIVDR